LSDVDVNVVERTLIVNPEILKPFEKELVKLYQNLKSREQLSIIDEIKCGDRKRIDEIIFESLGLSKNDLKNLYEYQINFIKSRELKSKSVKTTKVKQEIDYETSVRLAKDRFYEIRNYNVLIENMQTKPYTFYNLPAIFPKDIKSGDTNFFSTYKVFYKENNRTITINFENNNQIQLYHFFYKNLEIREGKVNLPLDAQQCSKILKALENDFNKYSQQLKNLLKTHRSKAHYLSVYKEIVFDRLD